MTDPDLFFEGPPTIGLSPDVAFDILKSSRRRQTIQVLNTRGETELGDLAEHVAANELGIDIEDLTDQERKVVYVALYQAHLPKLAQEDILDFDENDMTITPTEGTRLMSSFLTGADNAFEKDR